MEDMTLDELDELEDEEEERILEQYRQARMAEIKSLQAQCAPSIFNLDQKFHGLSCFWGIDIHETVQNQSRKTSVIRLPKFTTVNMARKWNQQASFSIENLFFEDYSFGSLMTDIFLD